MTGALRLRLIGAALLVLATAGAVAAQGKQVTLAVPETLIETGFLKYLLPRFSLKHGVRITLAAPGSPADAALVDDVGQGAVPVFTGVGATWHLLPAGAGNPNLETLARWLESDIGRKAIEGFLGEVVFVPPEVVEAAPVALEMSGDAVRGLALSLKHCGRCHVIGEQNRMNGVGNTPSFGVLRTFDDWEERFTVFYALKPHPWFTRVAELSAPFAPGEEPTIAPVTLTLDDLEDILSFTAGIAPADLGAPIRHQ